MDAAARIEALRVENEALKKNAPGASTDEATAAAATAQAAVAVEVTAAVEVAAAAAAKAETAAAAAAERNDVLAQLQAERASDEPDLKKLKRLGNELRAREKQAREVMVAEVREEPPTKPCLRRSGMSPLPSSATLLHAAHALPSEHTQNILLARSRARREAGGGPKHGRRRDQRGFSKCRRRNRCRKAEGGPFVCSVKKDEG